MPCTNFVLEYPTFVELNKSQPNYQRAFTLNETEWSISVQTCDYADMGIYKFQFYFREKPTLKYTWQIELQSNVTCYSTFPKKVDSLKLMSEISYFEYHFEDVVLY